MNYETSNVKRLLQFDELQFGRLYSDPGLTYTGQPDRPFIYLCCHNGHGGKMLVSLDGGVILAVQPEARLYQEWTQVEPLKLKPA